MQHRLDDFGERMVPVAAGQFHLELAAGHHGLHRHALLVVEKLGLAGAPHPASATTRISDDVNNLSISPLPGVLVASTRNVA